MKAIIVEDQAPAQRILKKYLSDFEKIELVGIFSSTTGLKEVLESDSIDLIFLDIHLPQQSGIDFLRGLEKVPSVIITSAFTEYAIEGFELDVVDYLVKPFSYDRFVKSVDRVLEKNELVFFKSGYDILSVKLNEIRFITSDLDYTEIHTSDKKLLSKKTLSNWEEDLDKNFIRVHKSYIVNLSHVNKVSGNEIELNSGESIPIGRAFKDEFLRLIQN